MSDIGQLTSAGLNAAATSGITQTSFDYVGIGTGSATFALGLAAMGTEIAAARQAPSEVVNMGQVVVFRDYLSNAQAAGTLTEMGLWSANPGGTLLAYKKFTTAVVKSDDRPLICNFIINARNLAGTEALTASGMAAFVSTGFTTGAFPYIAVGNGTLQEFKPSMTAMGNELQRVATAVAIAGAAATFTGSGFTANPASPNSWTEVALWDASSGGNMLAYMALSGTVGHTKAKMTFTLANAA